MSTLRASEDTTEKARRELREAIKRDMVRAESRRQLLPDSWLEAATSRSEDWWMQVVQGLVTKHSKETDNADHDTTDTRSLVVELTDLVMESAPPESVYDENMRTAAVLAAVLAVWYARLQVAKASDPERPLFFRQLGYKRWLEYVTWMNKAMIDGRNDSARFPGQKWEHPYAADAKGGKFI